MNIPNGIDVEERNPLDLALSTHRLACDIRRGQERPIPLWMSNLKEIISHRSRERIDRHLPDKHQLSFCAFGIEFDLELELPRLTGT